jgi:lipoprotein-releasing system permease protein
LRTWLITKLDWLIAWRHLRADVERPPWLLPLLLGAVYLIVMGVAFALYASSLGVPEGGEVLDPFGSSTEMGATPLQRYYGVFGGLTLALGVMALVFGLLSWFFNLLPTIITMSVLLGCMALVVVLSLMSGLEGDLRDKILNQKAHIRVSRGDGRPFVDYQRLADAIGEVPGMAASPTIEGEIMVRTGLQRQAAMLIGVIPDTQLLVSNLGSLVEEGSYDYLTAREDIPDPDPFVIGVGDGMPWRLRHLERQRTRKGAAKRRDAKRGVDLGRDTGEEDETGGTAVEEDKDDDWLDPVEELPKLEEKGLLPRGRDRAAAPPADTSEEEGWEDPVELLPKLRAAGIVPEPAKPPEGPSEAAEDEGVGPVFEDEQAGEIGSAHSVPATGFPPPLLIGRELAMELGVHVGAQVMLVSAVGRMTPAGLVPGVLRAKVGGVFYSGMYEYDRKNAYAPLDVVQTFLRSGDRVTAIEVKLDDIDELDQGRVAVAAVVVRLGRDQELLVEDWRDLNRNLFSAMFLEKVAMFIALLFVVLVASFGILASNLMSVMEKSREIAVLKAMGRTDDGILRVFVAEGLCVGVLGSFGGIGMGLALCWALDRFGLPLNENVYYIEKLPVVVDPVEVSLVGVAAFIIVWLSSLYPALIASRMRPVDALRNVDR